MNISKKWMTAIIFAVIVSISVVLTYVLYTTGTLENLINLETNILGDWYTKYVSWCYSKWYMITSGVIVSLIGALIVSIEISETISTFYTVYKK